VGIRRLKMVKEVGADNELNVGADNELTLELTKIGWSSSSFLFSTNLL